MIAKCKCKGTEFIEVPFDTNKIVQFKNGNLIIIDEDLSFSNETQYYCIECNKNILNLI